MDEIGNRAFTLRPDGGLGRATRGSGSQRELSASLWEIKAVHSSSKDILRDRLIRVSCFNYKRSA